MFQSTPPHGGRLNMPTDRQLIRAVFGSRLDIGDIIAVGADTVVAFPDPEELAGIASPPLPREPLRLYRVEAGRLRRLMAAKAREVLAKL